MNTVKHFGQTLAQRPWILAVIIAVVVVGWMASGPIQRMISPPAATTAQRTLAAPKVQVRTQQAQLITRYVEVYGRTAPARTASLSAETDGRVTTLPVARGAGVSRGEILVSLDERDRSARLSEAHAAVKQFETEYAGQRKLFDNGSYVSESGLAATAASLERARTELKRAEIDIDNMLIRAPFAGQLEERTVEIGDYVRAGDPIATVVDNLTLIVEGSVPEQSAFVLEAGIEATAVLVNGQTVKGQLRYVSPVAENATRTFQVELEVANKDGKIPAGVTATMQIPVGEVYAQLMPPSLLTLDDDGNVGIKLVDASGAVVFYPAEIAASDEHGVWIAGLPDTADVITVGQGFVREGDTVEAIYMKPDTALATERKP
jgi:multidrug efflux system membrane fusion protein